jgi:hypothetical protein
MSDEEGTTPTPPPASDPAPVPYERFKQVNDELKSLRSRFEEIEAETKRRQETELTEQNRWRELAEAREKELLTERIQRTRLEVATKKGLPLDLAGRLQGDTAEQMEADAETLLKFVSQVNVNPGVPPTKKRQASAVADLSQLSAEEIRKQKAALISAARA